nr:N-acetylmuramoyl-L-alanine amidase CwlD [Romboutsia sp. 1001713B170207_170306_H8]
MEYSKVFFNINVQGDIVKKYIKYIVFGVVALILTVACILKIRDVSEETISYMPITNKTIVLDAGHGGIDPGASSSDKSILEKDINLAITLKLKELIESSGGLVILTRNDDSSLYEEDSNKTIRQKYNENLRNRKKIVDESEADMFVSIHLNAFQESKYSGAQTFYPSGKEESKGLATYIQQELKRVVDNSNDRVIKPRDNIYLLKETTMPSVLIECGFLSNEKEAKLLSEDEYQERISWAIYAGIQKYFGEYENKNE